MKLNDYIRKTTKNKYARALLKGVLSIVLIIGVATVSVHYLSGDSLTDYADKNPDIAYADTTGDSTPEATIAEESGNEEGDIEETSTDYQVSPQVHFYNPSGASIISGEISTADLAPVDERVEYQPCFYYETLSQDMIDYITGCSYPENIDSPAVTYTDLRYVGILYNDFSGTVQAGELICNSSIAQDLVEIFYELFEAGYQLERVVLVDNYGGDDTASMSANNTSCFNYRVVDGSTSLSNHAYGKAIDINPYYNPYIVFGRNEDGSDYISPTGSEIYADRSQSFPHKIDDSDLCYRLFKEHGFTWGGDWNSCKDYQHFQENKD